MGDDDEPVSAYDPQELERIRLEYQRLREEASRRAYEQERNIAWTAITPSIDWGNPETTAQSVVRTCGVFYPSDLKYETLKYKICAYYTINTPYEKVIYESFVKSPYFEGKNSNLVHFKGYENQGSWTANTALKPKFILETLEKFSNYEYLLFIDADSQVMREPVLLNDLMKQKIDIAFHRLDWQSWYRNGVERKELLSGTLFIRNCDKIKALCREWHDKATQTNMWEQKVLENIIDERKDLTISELPVEYCYIASMPDGSEPFVKVKEPVIVHHQASRKYRKEINERQS